MDKEKKILIKETAKDMVAVSFGDKSKEEKVKKDFKKIFGESAEIEFF